VKVVPPFHGIDFGIWISAHPYYAVVLCMPVEDFETFCIGMQMTVLY
jgi:selenophosphate synthetase-related protein